MKPKVGDKYKIKPEIWEKDKDAHYLKWGKAWHDPNVVLVVIEDSPHRAVVIPVGSDPNNAVNHTISELIPYKKQTIIL